MNTRKILMLCAWLLAIGLTQAQTPQLISYQAVARDLTGKVLSEKPISVQVEILQGSNQGTAVYTETHELTTTKTGTINLLIGGGNASAGTFAEIDWSKAPYFLRLGMKQEKETGYTEVSNTQMVSVPYALYAEKAGSVDYGNSFEDNPSNNTIKYGRDFVIIPTDWELYNGQFYAAFGEDGFHDTYGEGEFQFNIVYLTGTNLNLDAKIDGFPKYDYNDNHYQSTVLGRFCSFRIGISEGKNKIETTLTIVNENDETLISFPVMIDYVDMK